MQRYMIAIFEDRQHAEAAITGLTAAGIPAEDIGIAAGEHHHRSLIDRLGMHDTPLLTGSNANVQEENREAAEKGMLAGAGVGAIAGLIAGIGLLAASGAGLALLVAGPIAAAIGGGVTGAAAGGLGGALIGMGIPHEHAQQLQERVHAGAIIVSLHADERYVDDIERVFNEHEVEEVVITGVAA